MNYTVHPFWFFAVFVGLMALGACTDADIAKWGQLGDAQHIQCWSGAAKIYDGYSTGKVQNEQNSDGYFFEEEGTGRLMQVSGNCILTSKE